MSTHAPVRPIEFRNTTLGATVALMQSVDPTQLADAMHKMLGGMPDFFSGEAVLLDFSQLTSVPARADWAGLLSLMRRYRLQPIGVCNLDERLCSGARQAGLAVLDNTSLHTLPPTEQAPPPPTAPVEAPQVAPAPPPAQTMFVDRPLRSGQQVYARGGDLVVLAGVSHGAEIIADGSIHCYGPLRGRALAGAQGDTRARIFASSFGPELVSIAGVYRTFEQGLPRELAGRAAMVKLVATVGNQSLNIEALQLD